ncbi:hypothetical protein AVEN_90895-1 [Araneus ventricosus]|uniref:Uncharacterized protein n=1 Tax=Araneus ventricosus TaxID=182803 RepID=A0A4Y2NIH4_ARAVE|nr:hypothetical protein AVEN_90895-1 [Araneus ventricosus]
MVAKIVVKVKDIVYVSPQYLVKPVYMSLSNHKTNTAGKRHYRFATIFAETNDLHFCLSLILMVYVVQSNYAEGLCSFPEQILEVRIG